MKRRQCIAAMLLLALLAGGASIWEGSAVVGGASDFPSEGLFGACNSFPRDASVEVRNLENGKTVTVVITRNVENPGVFIALSPKAASDLGMKQGSASRVRATTLSLSMTEASLPAARAGETADPDFNPKVYVEREKSAIQAAEAGKAVAAAVEQAAPVVAAEERKAAQPAVELIAQASAAPPVAPSEAPKPAEQTPATEAKDSGSTEAAEPIAAEVPAAAEPSLVEKVAADPYPLPELTASAPGSPKPESLGIDLPAPDVAPLPDEKAALSPRGFPDSMPELVGGSISKPRAIASARSFLPEPDMVVEAAETGETSASDLAEAGKASIDAVEQPAKSSMPEDVALAEPVLAFAPDELPEELLPRLVGPTPEVPDIALAEIDVSALAAAKEEGSPEALALEQPAASTSPGQELAGPEYPQPIESIEAGPQASPEALAEAALAEPESADILPEASAQALAKESPAQSSSPEAELSQPATPSPEESIAVEKPAEAVEGGEVAISLEPTEPRPPQAGPGAPAEAAAPAPEPLVAEAPIAPTVPASSAPVAEAEALAKAAEAPASIPLLASLSHGSFYVQIGVYGSNDSLVGAVDGFRSTYPLALEKVSAKGGQEAFRLYVGPLSRDESGLVLYRIKSMGFKDAFVKQGS